MNRTAKINQLWEDFGKMILSAYQTAKDAEANALHDYAPNIAWHDGLADLLQREEKNEKQHRNGRSLADFSARSGAKLILMQAAARGAESKECPSALQFLYLRREAIEAETLGYLIRWQVTATWKADVASFDYAKIMQAA